MHFLLISKVVCYNVTVICDNVGEDKMKKNFGKYVHNQRRLLKITEEKLAEHTNISDRHLRNIEKGNTVPKLDTVIKLGNALNMNLGDLGELEITEDPE